MKLSLKFSFNTEGFYVKATLGAIPTRSLLVNNCRNEENKLTEPIKLAHVWKDVLMITLIGGKPIIWICWIWWQPVTFSAHGKPKHSSQIIDATSNACIKKKIPNLSYKTNLTFLRLKTNGYKIFTVNLLHTHTRTPQRTSHKSMVM